MKTWIVLLTVLLAFAATSFAQEEEASKGEIAVGWALLHQSGLEETFTMGFTGGAAVNVNEWLGIAGDFGYNKKKIISYSSWLASIDADVSVMTFAAGPRFRGRADSRDLLTGFAHVLFGVAVQKVAVDVSILGYGVDVDENVNGFLIQPGGGADINLSDSVAIRAQGDYMIVMDSTNSIRFSVGAVFRF